MVFPHARFYPSLRYLKVSPRHDYSVSTIQENFKIIKEKGWTIVLQWIPSHCGLPGNERADSLANQTHELNQIEDHPLELKELEVLIKNVGMRQWQIKWNLEKGNTPLGIMEPLLEDWT